MIMDYRTDFVMIRTEILYFTNQLLLAAVEE